MKVVRTITEERVTDERVRHTPKWKVGDKVKVNAGRYEDFIFRVHEVRFRDDYTFGQKPHFEYLVGTLFQGGWENESNLLDVSDRGGWHYDRSGYCDNPGRGY